MVKVSDELLLEAVKNSKSVFAVLRYLELRCAGGSHSHYSRRIKKLGIDTSHFTGQLWSKGRTDLTKKLPDEILIVTDGSRRQAAYMLRRALIEKGVEYCCSKCGQGPDWLGYPLTLDVDHIDGNWADSRLGNLRFLCPNCHSQFSRNLLIDPEAPKPRYGRGGNMGRKTDLCACGSVKFYRNKHCSVSCARSKATKVDWESLDFVDLLSKYNLTQIGEILGVSATAVKKHLVRSGTPLPSRSSLHLKSRKR